MLKNVHMCFVFCGFLSACATTTTESKDPQLAVTFSTDPDGASLYAKEEFLGSAPETLYYTLTEKDIQRGTLTVDPVEAKWHSGATVATGSQTFDLKTGGLKQEYRIVRPKYDQKYEDDAAYARMVLPSQRVYESAKSSYNQAERDCKYAISSAEDYAIKKNMMESLGSSIGSLIAAKRGYTPPTYNPAYESYQRNFNEMMANQQRQMEDLAASSTNAKCRDAQISQQKMQSAQEILLKAQYLYEHRKASPAASSVSGKKQKARSLE